MISGQTNESSCYSGSKVLLSGRENIDDQTRRRGIRLAGVTGENLEAVQGKPDPGVGGAADQWRKRKPGRRPCGSLWLLGRPQRSQPAQPQGVWPPLNCCAIQDRSRPFSTAPISFTPGRAN